MLDRKQLDRYAAEAILYCWACETVKTSQAKRACHSLGFEIDFRQPDSHLIEALYLPTGEYIELEI